MCPKSILFIFLALSITVVLFNHQRKDGYTCLIIVNLLALLSGTVNLVALAFLLALVLLAFAYYKNYNRVLFVLLSALLTGFVLHYIPGFTEVTSIENLKISSLSTTCNIYFNYDKVAAALIIYTFSPLIIKEQAINFNASKITLFTTVACILLILGPAILSGYVKYDPIISEVLLVWSLGNFLFVCFSEEVIFRGFLQNAIPKYPIIIASILFGLSHYRDGAIFVGLATIAGLFYGYAYQRTKRILCSMLVHFGLNLFHFLLFTYPAAI